MKSPCPLRTLISSPETPDLANLVTQSKKLARLQVLLQSTRGVELDADIQIANITGNRLILVTSSPAKAARLRYISADIIYKINNIREFSGISEIIIKTSPVAPSHKPGKSSRMTRPTISNTEALLSMAETVADEDLKLALKRLASRGDKPSK